MDLAKTELKIALKVHFPKNLRKMGFDARWFLFKYLSKMTFNLPYEFNPFTPGLEVKFALEEANKIDSKVVFLGYEVDFNTQTRLYMETRYNLLHYLINSFKFSGKRIYNSEIIELKDQIDNYGIKKFLESSCDQYFMNWMIKVFDMIFPEVKRIMIDQKEEDIFKTIMENKGKVITLSYRNRKWSF
jgi:pheromone shutdown protein TraB